MVLVAELNDGVTCWQGHRRSADGLARRGWLSGPIYSKAGVVIVDLVPLAGSQCALLDFGASDPKKAAAVMVALDACTRSGAARWY